MVIARVGTGVDTLVGHVEDGLLRPSTQPASVLEALRDGIEDTGDPLPFRAELPIDWPASLRDCLGFLEHVRNTRRSRGVTEALAPVWSERPAFYFANPASLLPSTAPVEVPTGCQMFDYEFEIGAVLTSGGTNLTADEAGRCIGGYVLYCDWSARDVQAEERVMQIGQGKAKDSAITLGPWILPAAEAAPYRREDGFAFEVAAAVNGERVLQTTFLGMDWSFEELVAYSSYGAGVRAGDIIVSGTVPGGCLLESSGAADFRGWLKPGDQVELDGGPLGTISAEVLPARPEVSWRRSN